MRLRAWPFGPGRTECAPTRAAADNAGRTGLGRAGRGEMVSRFALRMGAGFAGGRTECAPTWVRHDKGCMPWS